jgi:hypothetical protein
MPHSISDAGRAERSAHAPARVAWEMLNALRRDTPMEVPQRVAGTTRRLPRCGATRRWKCGSAGCTAFSVG